MSRMPPRLPVCDWMENLIWLFLMVVLLLNELQIPSSHEDPKTPLSKIPSTKEGLIDWSQVSEFTPFSSICFYKHFMRKTDEALYSTHRTAICLRLNQKLWKIHVSDQQRFTVSSVKFLTYVPWVLSSRLWYVGIYFWNWKGRDLQDFFGKPAFLTVSGQLNGETYATALCDVCSPQLLVEADQLMSFPHSFT